MESKRHQKLYEHYKTVFGEEPSFSLKLKKNVLPTDMKPITTLVFKPTDEMPFWKLCTIGASDYLMPERDIGFGRKANRRNEYMMLISPDVDIRNPSDDEDAPTDWLSLNSLLWATAEYAFNDFPRGRIWFDIEERRHYVMYDEKLSPAAKIVEEEIKKNFHLIDPEFMTDLMLYKSRIQPEIAVIKRVFGGK